MALEDTRVYRNLRASLVEHPRFDEIVESLREEYNLGRVDGNSADVTGAMIWRVTNKGPLYWAPVQRLYDTARLNRLLEPVIKVKEKTYAKIYE
jgi:hypothetical protein